ncbi:MAG: BamA/TamA family outer membrane protein [Thermoanaerobaculia bacterium]
MRRIVRLFLLALVAIAVPLQLQSAETACSFCGGAVVSAPRESAAPVYLEIEASALTDVASQIAALTPESRGKVLLVVRSRALEGDPLTAADTLVTQIVDQLATAGPLAAAGFDIVDADPQITAFAMKRFSVAMQGRGIAQAIVAPRMPLDRLATLYEAGAGSYFDEIVTSGEDVAPTAAWLAEHDPIKRVVAIVEGTHPNSLYDIATAFRDGAIRAYLQTGDEQTINAIASMNRELSGDFAHDSTSSIELLRPDSTKREEKALAFVRGEDLRSVVIIPGDATVPTIVSLPSDDYMAPRRVDAAGARNITDVGKKGGRFFIGLQASSDPFVLTADRPPIDADVSKEAIDVVSDKGTTVEEIIRNHQAYWSYQHTILPRYIARNETKLRFTVGQGESFEATLAGEQFFEKNAKSDWVWRDLLINGVRWKYGSIPELPLIQPEKVAQLPLDLHLTNDYRYELVRATPLRGFQTWEVRFEPPPNAPPELPLYRGTVWIDARTWSRVRIAMIQLNLSGEVLSNEERLDYEPLAKGRAVTVEDAAKLGPKELLWLPLHIEAQQVLSVAGRSTVIRRATQLSQLQIDPENFDALHAEATASNVRMVRDTEKGLRYLEPTGDGNRRVKDEFDTSRLFMVGGLHHDEGMEFPVLPLGGLDYFNFDLWGRGIQTNVFFAGVIAAVNATQPSFLGTRTNVGLDFFGIAVPFENTVTRGGEDSPGESIRTLPASLTFRAGHPILGFGKADISLGAGYTSYQRHEDTASDFVEPPNTFELRPGLDVRYDRWGYSVAAAFERGYRTDWAAWGNPDEYDEKQETWDRFSFSAGRSFYLPKFQRIGVELNYLDGRNLDRFSKYELGFFGAQRVRGIASGTIRAESAILGHLSYGFVISDALRLEAFYDHALIDDAVSGMSREPFQGVGIAGQTVGPWGTLLRIDIGKSIGPNAQDDFVADILFLKLFN